MGSRHGWGMDRMGPVLMPETDRAGPHARGVA